MNNGTMIDRLNLEGKLKPYSSSIEPGTRRRGDLNVLRNKFQVCHIFFHPPVFRVFRNLAYILGRNLFIKGNLKK